MTAPTIKICGVTTPAAVDASVAGNADYVGFNFYPPSPRYLDAVAAGTLAAQTRGRIDTIGVFVDATDDFIAEAVAASGLAGIQLHGSETPERAGMLKARFGLPVWKVLSVAKADDIARASAYREAADSILFDAKTPNGTLPGGMGLAFDWALLAAYRGPLPWGLAGGLTPDNVAQAIAETGAPLVDTSSGVESAPGVKDVDKIIAFCKAARR